MRYQKPEMYSDAEWRMVQGYMNALFDFQEEINALIEERKE